MDELTYNGKKFSEFDTFFDGSKAFGSPEKDYEIVEIMGRNGGLSIYNNRFKDIILPFPCFVRSAFLTHYRQLVEFLNSQHGYLRLETSKEPNHFRKALFQGIVDPQTTPFNHGGQFTINFLAKPQRFLKSGETPVSSQSQSHSYEGNPVSISNPSGLSNVSSLVVDLEPIQDLNGYDSPWVGGAGKNKANPTLAFVTRSTTLNDVKTGDEVTVDANGKVSYSFTTTGRGVSIYLGYYEAGATFTFQCTIANSGLYRVLRSDTIPSGSDTVSATTVFSRQTDAGSTVQHCTITDAGHYWASVYKNTQTSPVTIESIMSEIGDTASAYEPYSNICPITGHTEVNVTRTGKNLIDDSARYVASNGTTVYIGASDINYHIHLKAGTYTFSAVFDGVHYGAYYREENAGSNSTIWSPSSSITSNSFTIPEGTYRFWIYRSANDGGIDATKVKECMLELGSTPTSYEPYTGTTYTSSLGTTVYGGTIDVTTGVLTVDTEIAQLSPTASWTEASVTGVYYVNNATRFRVAQTPICDSFKGVPNKSTANTNVGEIALSVNNNSLIVGTPFATLAEWTTFLTNNSVNVVRKLVTPTTTQLTAQQISMLTGTNIITCDSGDMTVTVTEPSLLVNPTLFESKPLLRIYGTGTVNINDQYITISAHSFPYIDIDCELMDAYYGSSNANSYVTFSTNDYITLRSGNNYIAYGNQIEVTPRWYEI